MKNFFTIKSGEKGKCPENIPDTYGVHGNPLSTATIRTGSTGFPETCMRDHHQEIRFVISGQT
jgi:hypothetical protein